MNSDSGNFELQMNQGHTTRGYSTEGNPIKTETPYEERREKRTGLGETKALLDEGESVSSTV